MLQYIKSILDDFYMLGQQYMKLLINLHINQDSFEILFLYDVVCFSRNRCFRYLEVLLISFKDLK